MNLPRSRVSFVITSLCKSNMNIIVWSQFAAIRPNRNLCSVWRLGDLDIDCSETRTSDNRDKDKTSKHPRHTIDLSEARTCGNRDKRKTSKHQRNASLSLDKNLHKIDIKPRRKHLTNETGDGTQLIQKHLYLSKLNREHHPTMCSTLYNPHFTVNYNNYTKTPCWVYEYLTPENIRRCTASRKNTKFREDFNLQHGSRATLQDYRHSGLDRGHMAAAGNYRTSQDALNQTFLLSNILPQVGAGFNQNIWRHLEEGIRDIVLLSDCVHLYTGPLYIPRRGQDGGEYVTYQVIGQNRVAVPTHLFKTMLIVQQSYRPLNEYFRFSVMMPNRNICDSSHVEDFLVPIADVESVSGLRFFVCPEDKNIKYQEILGESSDEKGFIDIFRARRQF